MSKEIEAIQRWNDHRRLVQSMTCNIPPESPEQRLQRIERARNDYAFFVSYYFPHYANCKCANFQISAARYVLNNDNMQAVFEWCRGHAKSVTFDILLPLWLKIQQPRKINVMVLVGKSQDNADTLLSDLQAELMDNGLYKHDFGEQFGFGSWETGHFITTDECAFFSRGRGQSPRGLRYRENRPDYIIVDDLDDDILVNSEVRVRKMVDWIKEALFGAMDMGRGRFIMVGNRIHKNSVLANIAKTESIYHSVINAIDKKGNPAWPQKYTIAEINHMVEFMGYRSAQKELFNNPITEGAVFKNNWIQFKKMLPIEKYDHLIAYCDPSFKSSTKNDYKAIKVWGKAGNELHHLKAFVRQCSISEMVRWFYDLHESLPQKVICQYYIEANFLQDILLDEFTLEGSKRGYQLPIRPDKRDKPDKFQRIEGISPLWERGFIFYNIDEQENRDMITGVEQTLSFEKGSRSHDDGPDADEGAIYLLQRATRSELFKPIFGKHKYKNTW